MKRQRFVVEITNFDAHDKTSYKDLAICLENFLRHCGHGGYFPFYRNNVFVIRRPVGLKLKRTSK